MTCIRSGDCAVCQESIRDSFVLSYTNSGLNFTGFSPDGNVLVGHSSAGNIFFWRAPTFEEIAQAEARSAKLEGVVP